MKSSLLLRVSIIGFILTTCVSVANAQQIKKYEGTMPAPEYNLLRHLYPVDDKEAEGYYSYYIDDKGKRVRHGKIHAEFLFTQGGLIPGVLEGEYTHGKKTGQWIFVRSGDYGPIVGFTFLDDVMTGEFGSWARSRTLTEAEVGGSMKEGRMVGDVSFKYGSYEGKGQFDELSRATGRWEMSSGSRYKYYFEFCDGVLCSCERYDDSTGDSSVLLNLFSSNDVKNKVEVIRNEKEFIVINDEMYYDIVNAEEEEQEAFWNKMDLDFSLSWLFNAMVTSYFPFSGCEFFFYIDTKQKYYGDGVLKRDAEVEIKAKLDTIGRYKEMIYTYIEDYDEIYDRKDDIIGYLNASKLTATAAAFKSMISEYGGKGDRYAALPCPGDNDIKELESVYKYAVSHPDIDVLGETRRQFNRCAYMCDRAKLDQVRLICIFLINLDPDSSIAKEIESNVNNYVRRDEIESFLLERAKVLLDE